MYKLKGDSEEDKRKFQEKQRQLEKERIKKEQQEKKELLKKVRAQAQEDKRKREEKAKQAEENKILVNESTSFTTQSKPSNPTQPTKKMEKIEKVEEPKIEKSYKECLIQIRMFNGSTLRENFPVDSTLLDVAKIVQQKCNENISLDDFSIITPFPKREYELKDFKITSLKDAGLYPKGSITLQKLESKGKVIKGEGMVYPEEPVDPMDPGSDSDDPVDDPMPILPLPIGPDDNIRPPPIIKPEDDNYERNVKLLCSMWLYSITESPEGTNILVYRPKNYEFETEDKTRPLINFMDDGSFSSVTVIEGTKTTSTGNWKLMKNGTTLKITTEGQTKEYEIATITDEVLILS